MVEKHLMNPAEFYRPYMIPSISRDNADFPRQRYWKGAVWPPLNFIVYVGLRKYGFDSVGRELARTSDSILLRGWDEHGIVSENYSAITGTGDDPRLSSDPFHSWGALMGIMSMIQSGAMPPPEAPLVR
jgi:glycogen debranching enzyme